MARGKGRSSGHDHVLAAIADAIHASQSYKGAGKGKGGGGEKGQWQQPQQDGRNCPDCGDYNFGFRMVCRQCGVRLPPSPSKQGAAKAQQSAWYKGAGKGTAAASWAGKGASDNATGGGAPPAAAASPAPTTAKPAAEEDEPKDPTERVREIRSEEDRLRRARSQFLDVNPRMVTTIDKELEMLAAERERLQPLEVNLQAAAGRTAHARAALAKAKEKKVQAAKELRARIESFKNAEKDVAEAEAKLAAAEAAATAKRTEVKATGVAEAVELLQQATAAKCGDSAVAAQLAAALQQIADVLGAITTPTAPTAGNGESVTAEATEADRSGKGAGTASEKEGHPVFAVCGSSEAKSRRTLPLPQNPAAVANVPPEHGTLDLPGPGNSAERFAGGAVDGEIDMGVEPPATESDDSLLAQAAAVLGDDDSGL